MYELEFPVPDLATEDGRGPVLVHGLEGFADAGHAVRLATEHLRDALESEPVATFAVDELIDYRSRRPMMTFEDNRYTDYAAPRLTLSALRDQTGTPFLLLSGLEPDLQWERFTAAVLELVEHFGVRRTVGLNSIPMAVPHTRPIGMTAHSANVEIAGDYHTWDNRISVPGSVDALLELRLSEKDHPALGFAVHVPHYLAQSDYPEAALKMLEAVAENTDLELPLSALGTAAARTREQIDEQITGNEEVQGVVSALENQYDAYVAAEEKRASLLAQTEDLPSGDELGAEFERFLAEQSGGFGFGDQADPPGAPADDEPDPDDPAEGPDAEDGRDE